MPNSVNYRVDNLINSANPMPDGTVGETTSLAVIAAAGTTQATATPITAEMNWISNNTAANGVILPVAAAKGQRIVIHPQLATNAPKVYPPLGGTVLGGAVNASTTATAQVKTVFIAYDDTGLNWY